MSNTITIKDLNGHYAVLNVNELMSQINPQALSIHGLQVEASLKSLADALLDYGAGDGPYSPEDVEAFFRNAVD